MSLITREEVFELLFQKLQTVPGFKTYTRRFQLWNEFSGKQPALILTATNQTVTQDDSGLRPVWVLGADIIIYCATPDPKVSPAILLNNLIDAVETVLTPINLTPATRPVQSLGDQTGCVRHCWISGNVTIVEGTLQDGQAVGIIPVEIKVIR